MVVQHNLTAINANRYFGINNNKLAKSLEKLSSGYAINRAGDNAAGLAVSEKMRSQIAGINQGVKNAQDGISMVQTFEGALTETHSILQRMKTLANQSANGTYDDPIDRNAIEQEFLQLNDELDQIADTDFNGVVVLNGGVMADGTRAVDGKINYKDAVNDRTIAENATDISDAQAGTIVDNSTYTKTVADDIWKAVGIDVADEQELDITFTFDGEKWNATAVSKDGEILDNAKLTGLTTERSNVNGNTGKGGFAVKAGDSSVNVIFDEMNTDGNGMAVKEGDTVTIKFQNSNSKTYAPNNAGIAESSVTPDENIAKTNYSAPKFELDASIKDANMTADVKKALDDLVNAEFKATYKDGKATITADGFTIAEDGTVTHDDTKTILGKVTAAEITSTGDTTGGTGTTTTTDAAAAADAANTGVTAVTVDDQKTFNAKATADDVLTYSDADSTWKNAAGDAVDLADYGLSVTGTAADGDKITITGVKTTTTGGTGTTTTTDAAAAADAANTGVTAVTVDDQKTFNAKATADDVLTYSDADSTWKNAAGDAVDLADYGLSVTGTAADGDKITITGATTTTTGGTTAATNATAAADAANTGVKNITVDDQAAFDKKATADDVLSFDGTDWTNGAGDKVTLADYGLSTTDTAAAGDKITITGAKTAGADAGANGELTFKVNVDAYNVADAGTISASSIKTPDAATMKGALESAEVSKSNAFNNSEAQMTYTDNITLQVGARTKDSVNFTFNYQSTAMGDLKADLNCTAKGLGTDKLTLSTQSDANYAIDKIDQAINKVSMVRGTFGAIQNRLEHKIDNLNVTSENLTSAESRIRDTNMAEEMMNFTKNQILSQASQSMLAQANQLPQGVLSLLQ